MNRRAALMPLITVASLVSPLSAQSDSLEELAKLTGVDSPALDSQPAGETSGVAIEAGEEKQLARLRLTWKLGDNPLALTVSSPIAKTETKADLVDLDGLSDSLSAELAYTIVFWPDEWHAENGNSGLLHREAMLECLGILASRESPASLPTTDDFTAYLKTPLTEWTSDFKAANRASIQLETRCVDDLEDIFESNPRSLYSWRRRVIPRRAVPMLGIVAKAGNESFEYALEDDLSLAKERKIGHSAGLAFGLLFPRTTNRDSVLWINVKSERAFRAAQAQVRICEPLTAAGAESCQPPKVLGTPTSAASEVYSLEYRHFLGSTANGPRFAVSPIVFYRDVDRASYWGLDVPFYFLTDDEGGLTAGLRASYRRSTNDVAVSFFVGKSLKILN